MIAIGGCTSSTENQPDSLIRFEKMVFTIAPPDLSDTIRMNHSYLLPFFRIFNEQIIGIGPDSLPGYADQLGRFSGDTLLRKVYNEVERTIGSYTSAFQNIDRAFSRWAEIPGNKRPEYLITYISGFNQSFITLPESLGIGLDNYLGSENPLYKGLGIPVYIRKNMNPADLTGDAVRAWLYSELPASGTGNGFLDRMIYEGKIYFIAGELAKGISESNLFHYTDGQIDWCREQEQAMWKYLAEQKILFSTDRLTVRKFLDEAPFTRDFGNESPGKVGVWIGYRIIKSYVKATGASLEDLIRITTAKEILSASKYHP